MRPPVTPSKYPQWFIRPMELHQIHLVVSWMDALDPYGEMDQPAIATRMEKEMIRAQATHSPQYIIGRIDELPAFFLNGFLTSNLDYEILTLLPNPILQRELYSSVYLQAFKYLFEQDLVGRILLQVEKGDDYLITILYQLGFTAPGDYTTHNLTHKWYACKLADFIS